MEFLLDFLYYLYNYYIVCALPSHGPMWLSHMMSLTVTCNPVTLWHLVMWYFLMLHPCIVSPERKEKKRNINNNLAILLSHDILLVNLDLEGD